MNTKTKHWVSITAGILSLAGYASASGGEKYIYDGSGNIVEMSIDGHVTKMSYDSSNRLIERQATGQSKETAVYDAAGRPIGLKNEVGQQRRRMSYGYGSKILETNSNETNTWFLYNAEGELVGKRNDSGVATYTWDGNVLAAHGIETFTNEAHFSGGVPLLNGREDIIISDYLGNTLGLGLNKLKNTAFGEGLEKGRLTGKPYIVELGGYLFKHRVYSSDQGRWLTADPIGFPDGINRFAYLNDPNSGVDPLGTTVKLYVQGVQKSSHYVSSDGDNDNFGFIDWSNNFSFSQYYPNTAHGTNGGLQFSINGIGFKFGQKQPVQKSINLKMSVFEDSSGNLDYSSTGVTQFTTSPIVAGVRAKVTGVGTKTLKAEADGTVGHNGSSVTGFGLSAKGGNVTIGGTSDTVPFALGTWVWKES